MSNQFDAIKTAARERKTVKVMANEALPVSDVRETVNELIASAGWAPFHKVCAAEHREGSDLSGIEPWRFYALDAIQCRQLGRKLQGIESAGKIPAMLSAADALILTTWLPNPSQAGSTDSEHYDGTMANAEHIAAASAAVQTILLGATAAGIPNYWSSGGILRSPEWFGRLKIPAKERMLGAIFLFPAETLSGSAVEIVTSKLRLERSAPDKWAKWLELDGR